METLCVYPGSFDPITLGHVDLIRRAAKLFSRVVVAVLVNPDKKGAFTMEERMAMIREVCQDIPGVEVDSFRGLLVDYMRQKNAHVIVRGLRAVSDFESEFQMAQVNHQISAASVETLFLMTSPEYGYVSSSIVRQIAMFGGDISALVPQAICQRVQQRLNKQS
ncbi:MAG: pantetheine-phosphate adenylyltransferase [Clostridia bacterium]|nr:pantetheine-phosphate adenylyltransferase [Clostridia bacterium]